jgi:hypothetical protein
MQKQKKKFLVPLLAAAVVAGGAAGLSGFASAQQAPSVTPTTSTSVATPTATQKSIVPDTRADGEVADAAEATTADPAGGPETNQMDFIVSAVNGTTFTVTEDNDGGTAAAAIYTIDASKASPTLTNVKVGDKIFVDGAVNGSVVSATSVTVGQPGTSE